MYVPPAFSEVDPVILWDQLVAYPLGLLVSQGNEGVVANLLPFEVQTGGEVKKLASHMARANTQWQGLNGQNVLVVFQGPNAYISPQWYASKREHGRVVPTWNYSTVQVRGVARVLDNRNWLLSQVSRLTQAHEQALDLESAWKVSDAPDDFIQSQLKGIIGLEIEVTNIFGKTKMSQNRSSEDRAGVVKGLETRGGSDNLQIANAVRLK